MSYTVPPPNPIWTVINKITGLRSAYYKTLFPMFLIRDRRRSMSEATSRTLFANYANSVQCAEPGRTGRWVESLFFNGGLERLSVSPPVAFCTGGMETFNPHLHQSVTSALRKV